MKVSSRSTGSEFLLPGMREKAGKFSNFFLSLMMSILIEFSVTNLLLAGRLAVPVPWTQADRWRRPSYCIVFELKC